jgi:2'-5' RNA ligase
VVHGLKDSCKPNRFVPHCTIAYGLDKDTLSKAVALFSNKALPVIGLYTRIGLYDLAANEDRCIYSFQKLANSPS